MWQRLTSIESNGMAGESTNYLHTPVMVSEITAIFGPVPPGVFLDATVGGGGHTRAVLEAHPHLSGLGFDQDVDALAASAKTLEVFGDRVALRQVRFDRLAAGVGEFGNSTVVGVLFDLGVSSPQLDRPERGFSYRAPGPLDMRMDRDQSLSADVVVNTYTAEHLARVLRDFGDERFATRIARAIVAARPITDTAMLAEIVRDAIPAPARRTGGHPAKRTFQAIRIEVNQELDILADAIDQGIDLLAPGGRIAVLAYHSGEDRIVKDRLRQAATGGCTCPPQLPCQCGAISTVKLLKRGAWKPSATEIAANPRAESARLRAAEKLAAPPAGPASDPGPERVVA
jgi:16S rRNA (cytosine1402-N4)-methyltransferase